MLWYVISLPTRRSVNPAAPWYAALVRLGSVSSLVALDLRFLHAASPLVRRATENFSHARLSNGKARTYTVQGASITTAEIRGHYLKVSSHLKAKVRIWP